MNVIPSTNSYWVQLKGCNWRVQGWELESSLDLLKLLDILWEKYIVGSISREEHLTRPYLN